MISLSEIRRLFEKESKNATDSTDFTDQNIY